MEGDGCSWWSVEGGDLIKTEFYVYSDRSKSSHSVSSQRNSYTGKITNK